MRPYNVVAECCWCGYQEDDLETAVGYMFMADENDKLFCGKWCNDQYQVANDIQDKYDDSE